VGFGVEGGGEALGANCSRRMPELQPCGGRSGGTMGGMIPRMDLTIGRGARGVAGLTHKVVTQGVLTAAGDSEDSARRWQSGGKAMIGRSGTATWPRHQAHSGWHRRNIGVSVCFRLALVGTVLLVLAASWGMAQSSITVVSGSVVTIGLGASDGVVPGMTGQVDTTVTAGGVQRTLPIANFSVAEVDRRSCRASLSQVGPGFEVTPGMAVRFDQALAKVSPPPTVIQTPRPAPTPAQIPRPMEIPVATPTVPTPTPAARLVGPAPGETRRSDETGSDYAWVPPGTFMMGCVPGDTECSQDERPRHSVRLQSGLWLATSEVTVAQYNAFARATGRQHPPTPAFAQTDRDPVVNVTWDDASAYCAWAGGRLPSEAEWEHAARGGHNEYGYVWGDSPDLRAVGKVANVADEAARRVHPKWPVFDGYDDGYAATSPSSAFPPNDYCLFDMAGNVREWTSDWYDKDYYLRPVPTDPQGPASGKERVARDGAWDSRPNELRISDRFRLPPGERLDDLGFRCVLDRAPSGPPSTCSGDTRPTSPAGPNAGN